MSTVQMGLDNVCFWKWRLSAVPALSCLAYAEIGLESRSHCKLAGLVLHVEVRHTVHRMCFLVICLVRPTVIRTCPDSP